MLSIGIADLVGCRALAAAALHQLQRVLPELLQLLAGHGRVPLHRGHALVPEQLLELRRRSRVKGPQRRPPLCCMPRPGATAASCRRGATARGAASACAAMPRAHGGGLPPLLLLARSQALQRTTENR